MTVMTNADRSAAAATADNINKTTMAVVIIVKEDSSLVVCVVVYSLSLAVEGDKGRDIADTLQKDRARPRLQPKAAAATAAAESAWPEEGRQATQIDRRQKQQQQQQLRLDL